MASEPWSKIVGRPELGTKCACASCAERFYDLNRTPVVCPKCGAAQPPILPRAARPVRASYGNMSMSRRAVPAIAEEEAEPTAAIEDEEDADNDDAADVPEIDDDADDDASIDPVPVQD